MTDSTGKSKSGNTIVLTSVEIIVLLLLPLPFLKLNVLYLVFALIIALLAKFHFQ